MLCNVYLHRLDRAWDGREHGVLVRFADDVVVMCKSRRQAEAALQRLRDLLAELGLEPKEAKTRIVHLRGWAGFFKYGNSARHFEKIRYYAKMRLALVVAKRHKRSRRFGWQVLSFQSDNELGLIGLETVVAPRPFKPWRRDRPNAGGERRR